MDKVRGKKPGIPIALTLYMNLDHPIT
jgi:hypothetical protein